MKEVAGLDFVQWYDDVLKEDNVLFSQGYSKATDDTGEDIE